MALRSQTLSVLSQDTSRDELIDTLAIALGRSKAESTVQALEATVKKSAENATRKIVRRGIIISLVISGVTLMAEARLLKGAKEEGRI